MIELIENAAFIAIILIIVSAAIILTHPLQRNPTMSLIEQIELLLFRWRDPKHVLNGETATTIAKKIEELCRNVYNAGKNVK